MGGASPRHPTKAAPKLVELAKGPPCTMALRTSAPVGKLHAKLHAALSSRIDLFDRDDQAKRAKYLLRQGVIVRPIGCRVEIEIGCG